jgi:hypothetical protein
MTTDQTGGRLPCPARGPAWCRAARTVQGIKVKKGLFPWTASGRAIANGRDEGVTKLLFDDSPEAHGHGKILGGGMVGAHAGDMIGEIALAIEMGADAVDIGKTIHPHPTLGESIGMAAEVARSACKSAHSASAKTPAPKQNSCSSSPSQDRLRTGVKGLLCFMGLYLHTDKIGHDRQRTSFN